MRLATTGIFIALISFTVAACEIPSTADNGYLVVSTSYHYSNADKSGRQWRAFLKVLDQCHNAGYKDAQLIGSSKAVCVQHSQNACSLFRATASYDCFGMGYQTAS